MSKILVTLEIIVDSEDLLKSEVETAMHKMLAVQTDVNVFDYGLDIDYLD